MRSTPYGLVQQQEDEPADRNTPSPLPPHVELDKFTARVALVTGLFAGVFSVLIIAFILFRSP